MGTKLTVLQELNGRVTLSEVQDGWRVDEDGLGATLAERTKIPAGDYEARVRATTTTPDSGIQFAREVYVVETDSGMAAVEIAGAAFVPMTASFLVVHTSPDNRLRVVLAGPTFDPEA